MLRLRPLLVAVLVAVPAMLVSTEQVCDAQSSPDPRLVVELGLLRVQLRPLMAKGQFKEALPIARQALEVAEKGYGSRSAATGAAHYDLAMVLKGVGDFLGSEQHFHQSISIIREGA